jgi:tetratricopeptide (TPR) repeat protein
MNASLVSHNLGDHETALAYAQESLELTQAIGNRSHLGYIVTFLGYALEGLGRLSEATEAFEQAVTLRRELGEHHLATESLAGLVRVALTQQDLPQVRARAEEILDFLQDNTLDGTEEPLRVYWSCYQALQVLQDPRTQDILSAAYALLQERADRIDDQNLRYSFLQNVAAHRGILQEFEGKSV